MMIKIVVDMFSSGCNGRTEGEPVTLVKGYNIVTLDLMPAEQLKAEILDLCHQLETKCGWRE